MISVSITADHKDIQVKIPSGSTVEEALAAAKISTGELDRVEPGAYTVLSEGDLVEVIRVREEYYIEQKIIPFISQEIRNDALPEGERRLSQPGVNGLQEITYHRVFENEVEVSDSIVKSVAITEAIPEIVMIGSRSTITTFPIPGRIAYLSSGNAWIIETNTGSRKLAVSTGDLDGRIFSLSQDGNFLLFTRFSGMENSVNSLWLAYLKVDPARVINLKVKNVVHFAQFNPASKLVAYSTVEWRDTSPGWQANNDLSSLAVNTSGPSGSPKLVLDANSGGVYGWWGMEYAWSPAGQDLLYARPDGIGIIDSKKGTITPTLDIEPYQTGGNWAWVPGASWSPDGKVVYTIDHSIETEPSGGSIDKFNLIAVPLASTNPIRLIDNVGMFAYPVPSPVKHISQFLETSPGTLVNQEAFSIAYLQAIFPDQSATSGYRLSIIDRDGSNQQSLFPAEGVVGLVPQRVVWSPKPMTADGDFAIAFIYNGNIWIWDLASGTARQLTEDGMTSRLDWR